MMFSLTDKIAVITGGGSGIGLATVKRFAQAGAKVVIGDVTDQTQLADEIGGMYIQTDVSNEEEVKHLMKTASDAFGRIDLVFNNAGVSGMKGRVTENPVSNYRRAFEINSMGILHGMKHAAGHMVRGGAIINTASMLGLRGDVNSSPYVSSKFSVVGLTVTAALELASQNIRVNCICPGKIATPMVNWETDAQRQATQLMIPLGRYGTPEEVASLVHYLCSDEAAYITGQAISIDGALSMGLSVEAYEQLLQNVKENPIPRTTY